MKVDARPTELWDRGTDCGNATGCGGRGGGREAGESRRRQAERLGPAAPGRMLAQPGEAERARQPGDADRAEAGLGHRDAAGDTAAAASGQRGADAGRQRRPEEVELCRVSTAPTRGHLWEPAAAREGRVEPGPVEPPSGSGPAPASVPLALPPARLSGKQWGAAYLC